MPRTDASRFAHIEEVVHASHRIIERRVKGLTFKVPAFEELRKTDGHLSINDCQYEHLAFKEVNLQEKRQIKRPSLIRKKLLVRF